MKRLALIALLFAPLLSWGVVCPAGYTATETIRIPPQTTMSASTLTYQFYFPGHASMASVANGGYVDNADTTGLGVVFCDSTGANVVAYELVPGTYSATTGAGEWHVSVTLSKTASTVLTVMVGKASATDMSCGPSGTNNCGTTLWNGFRLVTHGGTTASYPATDSTGNNTMVNHGATASAGQIQGAPTVVSASTQYVDVGGTNNLTSVSVLAWAKQNTLGSCTRVVSNLQSPTYNGYELINGYNTGISGCAANGVYAWEVGNASNLYLVAFNAVPVTTGTWHMVGATQTSTTVVGYMDGASTAGTAVGTARTVGTSTANLNLGRYSGGGYSDATIDEVRVYNGVLTADYYKETYANQNTPSTFYSIAWRAGAHYCVATAGSDAATGLYPSNCWQTITKANSYATSPGFVPGDELSFNGGDSFAGPLQIGATSTGNSTGTITIDSHGTGNGTITSGNGVVDGITITDAEFLTIKNLTITGTGWTGSEPSITVLNGGTGVNFLNNRTTGSPLRGNVVRDNTISGYQWGITFDSRSSCSAVGYQNPVIYRNTVSNNLTGGIFLQGCNALSTPFTGSITQINNVYIGYNYGKFIPGDPNSGTGGVHGSVKTEAWCINMASGTGWFVERNTCLDIAGFGASVSGVTFGGSAAIAIADSRNFTIVHNEVARTKSSTKFDGFAIDADQNSQQGEIAYNLTYNNFGPGLGFGSFGSVTTGTGLRVHHNISFNDARGNTNQSEQGSADFWAGTSGIQFYNNTIYMDATGITSGSLPSAISFRIGQPSNTNVNNVLSNNIIKVTGGGPLIRANTTYNTCHIDPSNQFLGNLYDASGGSLVISNDNTVSTTNVTTLAAWQAIGVGFENLNAVFYGKVGNANLLNLAGFSPASTGVGVPLENITNFNLSSTSDAIANGVLPSLGATVTGSIDYHRTNFLTSPPTVDIGASSYPQPAGSATTSPGAIVIQ